MKTTVRLKLVSFLVFIIMPLFVVGQADKKAAETKRLATAVKNAEAKVALNEKQINNADSLINSGTQMVTESKVEIKEIETEKKQLDKEYATNKKPLVKKSTSKDKEEATQAKADLKALDTQYKADAKILDTKLKEANKKNTTGNANLEKGKTSKKTAETALKNSQSVLNVAQAKYDVATGNVSEPSDEGKKKKK